MTYFNANQEVLRKIFPIDVWATPLLVNHPTSPIARNYTMLPLDFFNTIISDEYVEMIAQLLYVHNSVIPKKPLTPNLGEELSMINTIANVTHKKGVIMSDYLRQQTPSSPLILPQYQEQ